MAARSATPPNSSRSEVSYASARDAYTVRTPVTRFSHRRGKERVERLTPDFPSPGNSATPVSGWASRAVAVPVRRASLSEPRYVSPDWLSLPSSTLKTTVATSR